MDSLFVRVGWVARFCGSHRPRDVILWAPSSVRRILLQLVTSILSQVDLQPPREGEERNKEKFDSVCVQNDS